MKRISIIASIVLSSLCINNCTNLEETYNGHLTGKQVGTESDVNALFINLHNAFKNPFQNPFGGIMAMTEITTDELIAPTRANNWDDNGIWRQLHQHRWNGDHSIITGCFNDLNGAVFSATELLRFSLTPQQEAEARFLRTWAMYWILDLFDQVPYRDPGESTLQPARVRKGMEALDYIISEVNDLIGNLPDGTATKPSKNAAKVFLMKCYLNKGAYSNRQSPTFSVSDMNQVISLADEVINSNQYTFSENYFDNFAPDNGIVGSENIFTQENVGGILDYSYVVMYTLFPLHYNSTPYGFNGWASPSGLFEKFEEGDKRRGQPYSSQGLPLNPGNRITMGFLVGQQYNLFNDEPLADGENNPLAFTKDVKIIETGSNLEVTGIRPQKYAIDYPNLAGPFNSPVDNDWVYLRLADVLLMKAEAILRGGTPTNAEPYGSTALELVNAIRTHPSRSTSALMSIDLTIMLDERARELWLECWRRQDMIRFGKFLSPFQEKEYVSEPKFLLFPIPNQQLADNKKNLVQNSGY